MKDPKLVFPHFWPSCWDCLEQTLQYFFVNMLVDCLTEWQEVEVNNNPCIKKRNQHDLNFQPRFPCLFGLGECGKVHIADFVTWFVGDDRTLMIGLL